MYIISKHIGEYKGIKKSNGSPSKNFTKIALMIAYYKPNSYFMYLLFTGCLHKSLPQSHLFWYRNQVRREIGNHLTQTSGTGYSKEY